MNTGDEAAVLLESSEFFRTCLAVKRRSGDPTAALLSRLLTDTAIDMAGLGMAPTPGDGLPTLVQHARAQQIPIEALAAVGLVSAPRPGEFTDTFSGRVTIPLADAEGHLEAISTCLLTADGSKSFSVARPQVSGSTIGPIYLSGTMSPETRTVALARDPVDAIIITDGSPHIVAVAPTEGEMWGRAHVQALSLATRARQGWRYVEVTRDDERDQATARARLCLLTEAGLSVEVSLVDPVGHALEGGKGMLWESLVLLTREEEIASGYTYIDDGQGPALLLHLVQRNWVRQWGPYLYTAEGQLAAKEDALRLLPCVHPRDLPGYLGYLSDFIHLDDAR